jgi:hypothetical protein
MDNQSSKQFTKIQQRKLFQYEAANEPTEDAEENFRINC